MPSVDVATSNNLLSPWTLSLPVCSLISPEIQFECEATDRQTDRTVNKSWVGYFGCERPGLSSYLKRDHYSIQGMYNPQTSV